MSDDPTDSTAPDAALHEAPPRRAAPRAVEPANDAFPEVGGRQLMPGDTLGEYTVIGHLGSGGMAHVLLTDHPSHGRVALKILMRSRLETGLSRFRREYRALSRIHHPNVVRVLDYGDLHGHPYIAMEFIGGPDLHTFVRGFRDLGAQERHARARRVLVDLCRALAAIHRRGLVHRDLKPSNILMTEDGTCKLTDFGIVKDLDPDNTPELSTTLAGTWAYAAPEHISGRPVDHRADLYSLGVLLFVMLAGRRPFSAEGMAGYLRAHLDETPPRPSDIVPDVDPRLDAICMRMLEKAPRDRFQSAQEILYRLEATTPDTAARGDWQPPYVGHPDISAAIHDAIATLTRGTGANGGVLRITGADGSGRTRLLDEAAERVRELGLGLHIHAYTAETRAYEVPLRLGAALLPDLPDDDTALHTAIATWTAHDVRPAGDARYALYDALHDAFVRVLADRPRILLLDDADSMPSADADLFRFVLRRLLHDDHQPLLVITTEAQHAPPPPWSDGLSLRTITVPPLPMDGVRRIVESLLGPGRLTERLTERLHRETDGNALFVTEFLRSLMARGMIEAAGHGWRLAVDAADLIDGHLEVPPGIRQLLARRLDVAPPETGPVLDALAIAGTPLDLEILPPLIGASEDTVVRHIDTLLAQGLVREHSLGGDLAYAIAHPRLAALRTETIDAERARTLHAALGTALARGGHQDPEILVRIGEHLRLGGDEAQAFVHLATAARRMLDRSLWTEAGDIVIRALALRARAQEQLSDTVFEPVDAELALARGLVLANRGQWQPAVDVFHDLLDRALALHDAPRIAIARLELARAFRRLGQTARGQALAEDALRDARARHDRREVARAQHALASLAWIEGDLDRCERHADEGLLLCREPELAAERAQLHISRAAALATRGTLASATRGMEEAETLLAGLRMKQPWVLAVANLAELHIWQGELQRADARADLGVETASRLDYALGRIFALRARGLARIEIGRGWLASADLQDALRLAEDLGVHEEGLAIAAALAGLSLESGDPLGAIHHGARGLRALSPDGHDPERHLPVLQARLAQALVRNQPAEAAALLQAVEDALPTLPGPRAIHTRLAAARAWRAAGERQRAIDHAEQLLDAPNARAFRMVLAETHALLAELGAPHADRHRAEGDEALRAVLNRLPADIAASVRARSVFRALSPASASAA